MGTTVPPTSGPEPYGAAAEIVGGDRSQARRGRVRCRIQWREDLGTEGLLVGKRVVDTGHLQPAVCAATRSNSPAARGRRREGEGVERPGRHAEQRHVARVAAKHGDVLAHPLERGDLIEQSLLGQSPLCSERRMPEEPEDAEPVVERHNDHAVLHEATRRT